MAEFFIIAGIVVTVLFLLLHFACRCEHDWKPYSTPHGRRIVHCTKCGRVKILE